MSKIKIITDSNSGILQSEAQDLGLKVIPMPFTIDGEEFLEEISITQDEFYQKLERDAEVRTSQPSRYYLEELWDEMLKENDQLIYVPMSSGLSSTCANAKIYAEKYNGKVVVVDNKGISVTQKESVLEAKKMVELGCSALEIKNHLESQDKKPTIYIAMGVLKYLKKGGRISPAAAMLGSMLNLKPILLSTGDNFDKFAIAMSVTQAKKKIIMQVKKDIATKYADAYNQGKLVVSVAHTQNYDEAIKFVKEIEDSIPNVKVKFCDQLSLSVSCHIGPGALAVALYTNEHA